MFFFFQVAGGEEHWPKPARRSLPRRSEIPQAVFMPKPSKTGIAQLPQIYREMVHQVYVDAMDLRVYSSRQGAAVAHAERRAREW